MLHETHRCDAIIMVYTLFQHGFLTQHMYFHTENAFPYFFVSEQHGSAEKYQGRSQQTLRSFVLQRRLFTFIAQLDDSEFCVICPISRPFAGLFGMCF